MGLDELKEAAIEDCRFVVNAAPGGFGIAPGRVEVLGNHTDYNEGFILSAAIDRYVVLAGRATDGQIASVYSDAFERLIQFDTAKLRKDGTAPWCDYIMGVVDELRKAGHPVRGFECAVASDVPLGAGLSSSAALEVATAMLLSGVFGFELPSGDAARLCQRAENEFVGMNCGILDQWSSLHGQADHLIFLDCRDLSGRTVPLGSEVELILADTHAAHELVEGTYNRLREACFAAAAAFAEVLPGVTHLRDVSVEQFAAHADRLSEDVRTKADHIVHENDRVQRGVAALEAGDLETMGRLMTESHASSRDRFGNSCPELDTMVALAEELDGCYGARLSGGGFGGCTVNLVARDRADAFAADLGARYEDATGIAPDLHRCRAVDGARFETI
ncbi:MAG: galactokinase [Planctomycetota bacterium]